MTLPDVELPIFGVFVNWLYLQFLAHEDTQLTIVELLHQWLLGRRFMAPRLQNLAVDLMPSRMRCASDAEIIEFLRIAAADEDQVVWRIAIAATLLVMRGDDPTSFERSVKLIPLIPNKLSNNFIVALLRGWHNGDTLFETKHFHQEVAADQL